MSEKYDHPNDENDDYLEFVVFSAVEPYFCPDIEGDIDDMEFDNDEDYYNNPAYKEKYGLFDDAMNLYEGMDDADYLDARRAIYLYLKHRQGHEVDVASLCYFLFNDHVKRHPGFQLSFDKLINDPHGFAAPQEQDEAKKAAPKAKTAKQREELLMQPNKVLNQEQMEVLARLEDRYQFVDLCLESDAILTRYYQNKKSFDYREHDAETMELLRIENLAQAQYEIEYFNEARQNAGKRKIRRLNRQIKPFVKNTLGFMVIGGETQNPVLAKTMLEAQDNMLDLFSMAMKSSGQHPSNRYYTNRKTAANKTDMPSGQAGQSPDLKP